MRISIIYKEVTPRKNIPISQMVIWDSIKLNHEGYPFECITGSKFSEDRTPAKDIDWSWDNN